MREILFKAKTWEGGRWVFGDLLQFQSNTAIHSYLNGCRVSGDVNPRTVCQYTGLTDRNGVKVFEGDILKFTDEFNSYEWIGRVEFGNPNAGYTWGWQLVYVSCEEANVDTLCWFDMEESGAYSEVIGNIHDKED